MIGKTIVAVVVFGAAAVFGLQHQSSQRSVLMAQISAETACPAESIKAQWFSGRSSYVNVDACGRKCTYQMGLFDQAATRISCP